MRLLYLEDLYNFYSNYKKSVHFNYEKNGNPIVVQLHGKLLKFDDSSNNIEGLLPVHLQACHTGRNVNGSYISDEAATNALPSFSNRPILGFIHEVNGQPEFYGHNMHEDENGETVYDEIPVGVIPESCNATLVYDEEKDKKYVEIDGYIYEEYSKAAEILEREGECSVSVEISIRELSYNAKEKCLNIEDFYFSGVTILGKRKNGDLVKPGMEGSNIKLKDFSIENNSLFQKDYYDDLLKASETINNIISRFNIKDLGEGGSNQVNKFEELLAKYNKTVEDIDFEYESLTDEELEAKFAEMFDEVEPDADPELESDNDEVSETDSTNETFDNNEVLVRSFELSHNDIRNALYVLLSTYEEADNEWYYISSVYDDYFVYEGYSSQSIWGQKYTKKDDLVNFDGERYALHRELLTDSEYAELKNMRENYSALVQYKEDAESEKVRNQKLDILNNEKYASVSESEEFKKLVENIDNYSIEEIEREAKCISFDIAQKAGTFNFSSNNPEKKNDKAQITKLLNTSKITPKKIYGNLFND